MEKYVILKENNLDDFISELTKQQKVVAPVAKNHHQYAFEEVTSAGQISLNYIPTILPPKKFFMPQYEAIAHYDISKGQTINRIVEYEDLILFGVHTCDIAGIQCLNIVFSEHPKDINYNIRKNHITIIGYECNDYCDEYASCKLVHNHLPKGGYDLFFTNLENGKFIIHMNTELGEKLLAKMSFIDIAGDTELKQLENIKKRKKQIFAKNEVPVDLEKIPEIFDRSYDSKIWQDLGERCLACGNCTNVCPTCYCYDILDELNLDMKTGRRYRRWDSCQNEEFAKVAGGESFRSDRAARQRHRYYRKFRYPIEKLSRFFCTGCGRCSRTCMANINLKETLFKLAKEQKMENPEAGYRKPS